MRSQDFEKAGSLRDKELELKQKIQSLVQSTRDEQQAEKDANEQDGGVPIVNEADIATIVAQWTGIPVEKVSSDETERLVKMEGVLHQRVIGQEEAVSSIAR